MNSPATQAPPQLRELLAAIQTLEYEELVQLSRAGERQMGAGTPPGDEARTITYGAVQAEKLAELSREEQQQFESGRDMARSEMARRLRSFPRLRGDSAAKVSLKVAIDNVVFGLMLEDRLSANERNLLLAPWVELLRGRGAAAR